VKGLRRRALSDNNKGREINPALVSPGKAAESIAIARLGEPYQLGFARHRQLPSRDVNSIDTLYEIWLACGCFF
jgi:hypothetical protein